MADRFAQDPTGLVKAPFWEAFQVLYGADCLQGCTEEEIRLVKEIFGKLPRVLEDYWRAAGKTDTFCQVQDTWILPEHYQKWDWLQESGCMILLNENQGVCRAGIKREDFALPDPPVYVSEDDKNWLPCASTLSAFLAAALAYEAVFAFEYSPEEFYQLTMQEVDFIKSELEPFPSGLQNWLGGMKITLYQNAPDNMVAVMDCGGGDFELLYGAASEPSYQKLRKVLAGVGEPM